MGEEVRVATDWRGEVTVEFKRKTEVPDVTGRLNCKFQSKDSKIITFAIYDLLGNKVIQENIQPVIGENKVTINVAELTSGFYVARVTSQAENQVIKFSILH